MKFPIVIAVAALGACSTAAERKAAETARINKEAAKEMRRICTLPESERAAEIEKLEKESGITVNCGKE